MVEQAGGIIVWRDRIVLRRTPKGEWVFPKGWIDPGETPEQAAIREVREETGIRAEIVQFAGNASYEDRGEAREVSYYVMRVTDSPEWPQHAGVDAASFPVDEVGRVLSFDNVRVLWNQISSQVSQLIRNRRGWSWSDR
jgi:8-oxo-dGTP pyrophosphatase MutT (NUDIX family)